MYPFSENNRKQLIKQEYEVSSADNSKQARNIP